MDNNQMPIYKLVKDYIAAYGLTQKTVADKANIPYSSFNAMMNGKRRIYADEFRAICKALDVNPDIFILA